MNRHFFFAIRTALLVVLAATVSILVTAQTSPKKERIAGEYYKVAIGYNTGFYQLFKDSSPVQIGVEEMIQGKPVYMLNPAEEQHFREVTGLATGLSTVPQPTQQPPPAAQASSDTKSDTASQTPDGGMQVTFNSGPYTGDTVAISSAADKFVIANGGVTRVVVSWGGVENGKNAGDNTKRGASAFGHLVRDSVRGSSRSCDLDTAGINGGGWEFHPYMNGKPSTTVITSEALLHCQTKMVQAVGDPGAAEVLAAYKIAKQSNPGLSAIPSQADLEQISQK